MNSVKLTDDNFIEFCQRYYDNYHYTSSEEFNEDINRIKYIKKLITRYVENNDLRERLILNHIIILNNCFGPDILCKILYLKLQPQMKYIKPFLIFLNLLPDVIYNVNDDKVIDTRLIPMDEKLIEILRKV